MESETKAVLIGVFIGILLSPFQAWINAGPDFSISIEDPPTIFKCSGGNDSHNVIIHNDLWLKSYENLISLAAFERDEDPLPNGVKVQFDPPNLWLNGKNSVNSVMTVDVDPSYKKHNESDEVISILAIGGDGRKRSCSFYLKTEKC